MTPWSTSFETRRYRKS